MRILQAGIVLLILALVALLLFLEYRHRSPGRISQVHARLPELGPRGEAGCATCHGDAQRPLAAACNSCHQEIANQLEARLGLHGRLPPEQAAHCGRCHEEHRGHGHRLVGEHAFALAGIADPGAFRHENLGLDFRLTGRHAALDCSRCHEHAAAAVLQEGQKRFLGLRQDCVACHRDPHGGRLPDCASCHGQERPFGQVASFEHDPRFPLVHGHAGLSCKRCHDPGGPFAIENVGSRKRPALRGCGDCHETQHSKAFLEATATATCAACHRVEHESFEAADEERSHELHGASGFDLVAPHHEVACRECHRGPSREERFRSPPRRQTDCGACHRDPHAGQFAADCLTCHRRHGFEDHRFDRRRHARAGFALLGAHRQLDCGSCHPVAGNVRRFVGIPQTCRGCHQDPHGSQFQQGPFQGRDCSACHGQTRFQPAAFTVAMHQRTRFPLEGAHGAVACNRCHAGGTYRGTPTTCRSCHADVHDGAFDKHGAGCADCHDTRGFQLRKGQEFDHGRWTGFELTGAHARAACRSCHPPSKPSHGGTRRMARAKRDCASCHPDPHAGQFRQDGSTDCSRCHGVGRGFELTRFDHDRQSRFKLDERHRSLRCDRCHKRYGLEGGATVVRYKPLGIECNDCHGWERRR